MWIPHPAWIYPVTSLLAVNALPLRNVSGFRMQEHIQIHDVYYSQKTIAITFLSHDSQRTLKGIGHFEFKLQQRKTKPTDSLSLSSEIYSLFAPFKDRSKIENTGEVSGPKVPWWISSTACAKATTQGEVQRIQVPTGRCRNGSWVSGT